MIESFGYARRYLIDNSHHEARVSMKSAKPVKIDKIDKQILKVLSKDARKSVVDIASEVKTTARIINYRIKRLQKEGIITGFKIALNNQKVGTHSYKLFIYLDNPKKERIERLKEHLEYGKNLTHYVKAFGNWDLEPEFEFYSNDELQKTIKEMKDAFSDIIKRIEIVNIVKEHKFVYI